MCKESSLLSGYFKKRIVAAPPGCTHEIRKSKKHQYHDDAEEVAHSQPEKPLIAETSHHLHDDLLPKTHHHHDHQHPIHLPKGVAGFRQQACHAGDGHNHGGGMVRGEISSAPRIVVGSSHQHEHGSEVEHCPRCDEHLIDDKCPKCHFEHHH